MKHMVDCPEIHGPHGMICQGFKSCSQEISRPNITLRSSKKTACEQFQFPIALAVNVIVSLLSHHTVDPCLLAVRVSCSHVKHMLNVTEAQVLFYIRFINFG
jgi:hypothetical protein